jgi:Flp pilus assembly protein TadB
MFPVSVALCCVLLLFCYFVCPQHRHWKHWVHKTQNEDKQSNKTTTKHNTTQHRHWKHWVHKTQNEDKQSNKTTTKHNTTVYVLCLVYSIFPVSMLCCVVLCFVVVLLLCFSSFCVLCTQCFQCLWIVHSCLSSFCVLCTQCFQCLWIVRSWFPEFNNFLITLLVCRNIRLWYNPEWRYKPYGIIAVECMDTFLS